MGLNSGLSRCRISVGTVMRWQCVAHVAFPDGLDEGAGHAGRSGTVAGHIPPRAERVVARYGGSDDAQDVEALVDGIGLDPGRREGIGGIDFGAHRIVVGPHGASCAVDDHQAAHPLGVIGRENEPGQRRETGGQNRRPLASNGIHHREGVLRPVFRPDHVFGRDPRREANPAVVESDHPAERGQPSMKAIHRRLDVDAVDRDQRSRQHEQVDRAIAEDLVGDVDLAATGVPGPRCPRRSGHGYRLVEPADTAKAS